MFHPKHVLGKLSCALVIALSGLNGPLQKATADTGNRIAFKVGDTRRFRVQVGVGASTEGPLASLVVAQKVIKVSRGIAEILETTEEHKIGTEVQNDESVPDSLKLDAYGLVTDDPTFDHEAWRFLELIVPNIDNFSKSKSWTIRRSFKGAGSCDCVATVDKADGDLVTIKVTGKAQVKGGTAGVSGQLVWSKSLADYTTGSCSVIFPAKDNKGDLTETWRFDRL